MENTDVLVATAEQVPDVSTIVVDQVTDDLLKTIDNEKKEEPETKMNNEEVETTEETDAAAPTTTTTETIESKPTEEQENVNGTSVVPAPASVSPGRSNVPFKEVNESGSDEAAIVATNGTAENSNSKKRELDQEEEQSLEKTEETDERAGDQVKKMKLNEPTEASTEPEECESNNIHPVVNGNSAVEV